MDAQQQQALVAAWNVIDDKPVDVTALFNAYPYDVTPKSPTVMQAAIVVIIDSLLERRFFATTN